MTDMAEAAPAFRLLDARAAQLDERSLRSAARALCEHCGAAASSRSYRYPYAIVAWHSGDVGVDIEVVTRTDVALANLICTPAERAELASADDRDAWLSSLWCAKEALSKALGDATAYDPSRLGSPTRWPVIETEAAGGTDEAVAPAYEVVRRSGRWRATRLRVPQGHVGWLCWSSDLAGSPPAGGDEPLGGWRRLGGRAGQVGGPFHRQRHHGVKAMVASLA